MMSDSTPATAALCRSCGHPRSEHLDSTDNFDGIDTANCQHPDCLCVLGEPDWTAGGEDFDA